jgi:Rieske Fe-S protein
MDEQENNTSGDTPDSNPQEDADRNSAPESTPDSVSDAAPDSSSALSSDLQGESQLESSGHDEHDPETFDAPRRGFVFKALAALIGMAVGAVPAVIGLIVSADPLLRKPKSKNGPDPAGGTPYVKVTTLDALPADDKSRLFQVITDKVDGWTYYPSIPVGAVYLKRSSAKPNQVVAFNAVCPHLGCFVNAQSDNTFSCPCHDSEFKTDGTIKPITKTGKKTVSERGLDTLETKIEGNTVKVQFLNFTTGVKAKNPVL